MQRHGVLRRGWTSRFLCVLLAALLAATVVDFLPTGQKAAQAATEDPAPAPAPAAAGPAERPDFVSAQLTARAEKRRIEVTGERTETTSTFVNPDGTVTVDSYSGIRRVRRGEDWVDVDSTLVLADGKVTPKVTKAGVELSAGGSKAGDVATLVDGDREIAFGWPGALPAPELKDNTATYKGVAKDTDLVVKVFPTGYDVQIVAHTPAAAQAALSLPMRLKGVTATRTPGGELRMSAGGKVTARSPVPLMWDSHVNATSKLPDRVRDVAATLDTAKADRPTLALKPDKGWLTDPARQYPVTIDPAATLADNLDTDVNNVYTTTNYDTYEYLRVGNYAGAAVNRSFLRFDDSAIKGKHVTSAVLNLWQAGSATCTTQPTTVQGAGGMGAGTTWATQPSADGITWGSATFNNGGSCTSSGGTNIDITGLVDAWAHNGYPSPETLTLRAPNESDANQFKYFYSGDTFLAPNISTTYNSYPGTVAGRFTKPCSAQCGGTPAMVLTNTTTPTLSGASLDPEGSPVRLDFEVWNSAGTTMVTSGSVTNVTSNSVGSWTVPSGLLTNGTAYQWRSRAYDGVDYSQAWSGWIPFTVDTTAPAAPTGLSSAAWASGGWGTATSGTFSWTSPGGDTQSFLYGLDQPSPATETTATTTPTLSPGGGLHTLYLRTKDKSGNLSSVVSYGFGVGAGALAQPAEGVRVQRYATLEGQAPAAQTKVTFQYRMGTNTATAWSDVPTADVTIAGTSTHPTWPMNRNGSGLFDKLTWDLNTTLTGFGAPDGPVQIQACFRDAANTVSCAPLHTVQFARRAFADADATQPVGPGTVALLTGDYSVSATDVSMPTYTGDLTVGRSFTTLAVGGTVGVFGPGWTASMPGPDAGSADRTLTDYTATDGYAALTDENGVQDIYVRTGSGTYPYTYIGVGDVATDGSKLVKDSATQFTLTEVDGTRTIYAAQTVGGATVWRVSQVIEPGTNTTSTFTTDSSGRTTRILAPVPAGVTCTTLVAGCRALTIGYAASTTATGTGTDPATWGDYTGRLTSVAMSLNGDAPVNVAAYAYDSAGKLRSAKDPRTGLTTTYAYDAAGRLAQITPPGQATWTLTYDGAARLYTASRPAPGGGTATQTVVYDVAVTGTGAPIDLAPAQVANWAQTDIPLYGAAVFPAGHVPAAVPAAADWPYADLTYLNADGKQVNSASYGNGAWQISTTEHDSKGNTIRSLSAENRNQALTPTADTDMTVAALTSSAARSQLLDEQTVYSSDGVTVTDTYGPTHQIVDNAGARYSARQHEHTDYDQGAPSSTDPYRLATTITTSTRLANGTDVDSRKTVNGYEAKTGADPSTSGWALRKPTTVATWMGGGSTPDIVRTTYYNAAGNTVESRQPKANAAGTDAFTTVTTYYTATGSGSCVNASRTGLACTSGPAAQPSSGNPLPVSTYTYNSLNQVLTEVETVNSTTRTTTYVYDTAGRKTSEAVVASPAADGGTTIPTATYGYDPASGQATTTTASGITLTTGYDSWGRVTSQTDADGNTSTTGYDIDSQVTSSTDGKGIYTYTYDGANEHRGLVTSLNVGAGSAPSTFTAAYNADGKLTSQTYPNGLVATTRYDNNAEPTSLTYAKSGTPWLAFTQANSIHEQVRLDTSPVSAKNLGYDLSGRLTSVADTVGYGGPASCTTRAYTYDPDSNRTALTSYPDAGGSETGTCSTSTTPTGYGFTYDQADRLTNSGFAYDLFGRTTTDPYPPAGSSATIGYYVNDLVASETVAGTTRTYALDPARRLRSWTVGATTTTNHYTSASGDSAAWIGSGATWTRNITGIGGDLAATQTDTGAVTLQLANLHGDIIATVDDTTTASSITSYSESTEFGVPYFSSAAYARYGWLGAKQRSRDTLSGLTLMGVRLYDPNLGRFLSTDPVPGGSDNPYDYAHQDPYNTLDLDGRMFGWAKKAAKKAWKYRRQITGGLALAACFGGPLLCAGAQTLAFVTRASYRIQHQGFRRSLRANVGDAIFSTMNYGGVWLPLKKAGSAVRFDRKYTKLILKAGGGLSGGANFAGGFSRRRNRSYYAP
ncbi:RHS repeat-associated core domain-containing protein [Parafrankia irregularis]|uniref:RHS repeat-associated core domain-containing protein n=1 Tax=Parafrankia irregularis TaxID=795642 RepID=A0A0S4QJ63_9ACTN|nr:RHS repeat-associated core domain-containing protein [Parafrankia irregularis]